MNEPNSGFVLPMTFTTVRAPNVLNKYHAYKGHMGFMIGLNFAFYNIK